MADTSQPGDLTKLTPVQAGAIALNFVQCLGNLNMSDRDVFYAGAQAFFATTHVGNPQPAEFKLAIERLGKIAKP